jgi:O-antigen ligase
MLQNSLGRASKSTGSRGEILNSNIDLFFHNSFLGLGQGGTKDTLKDTGASYVKEAHNDYMAAANETGLIGLIGLVLLIALIGVRVAPMLSLKPPEHLTKYVPRPDLLGSGVLGIAVTAALHQTLHFRHEWAYFGLLAGAALLARRGEDIGGHASAIHVREAAGGGTEERARENPYGRG